MVAHVPFHHVCMLGRSVGARVVRGGGEGLVVARVPFDHVCMLHAIQVIQMKQMKQVKQVKQMTGGRPLQGRCGLARAGHGGTARDHQGLCWRMMQMVELVVVAARCQACSPGVGIPP